MVTRVVARNPRRLYLVEWRTHLDLTQEQVAEAVGTTKETISRWENSKRLMSTDILAELADALSSLSTVRVEPQDFYRHPETRSADQLLRQMQGAEQAAAWTVLESLKRR
ncbi:helix-turn-helix transcriptional regulator [Ancylobacter sp.]|uniref:helix-turn-helix transcriptional regulator n=1 Tax=Ancylobacter sp. TaxID=1872567 RepID=UPI003BAA41B0